MNDQAKLALEKANRIRFARADLKRELYAGTRSILEVLSDPPDYIESMSISELLLSVRGIGEGKVRRIFKGLPGISPNIPVGDLSYRSRFALVGLIESHSPTAAKRGRLAA